MKWIGSKYINILQKPLDEEYISPKKQIKPSTPTPEIPIIKVKRPKTVKILIHQKERKEKKEKKEKKTRKTKVIIPDKISHSKTKKVDLDKLL
jgi:hypothetical protein